MVYHDLPPEAGSKTAAWHSSSNEKNPQDYQSLKQKYDELEAQQQKDKEFFEQALETRTDQLEAKE